MNGIDEEPLRVLQRKRDSDGVLASVVDVRQRVKRPDRIRRMGDTERDVEDTCMARTSRRVVLITTGYSTAFARHSFATHADFGRVSFCIMDRAL